MALILKNELKQLHQAARAAIDQTAKSIRRSVVTALVSHPHLKVPPAFWNKVADDIDGDTIHVGREHVDDDDCSSAAVYIEMHGNQRIKLANKIYLESISVHLEGGTDLDDAEYMNQVGTNLSDYGPFIKVYYSRKGVDPNPVEGRSFANVFAEIRKREKLEIVI